MAVITRAYIEIKGNNPETIAYAIMVCYKNKNLLEESEIAIIRERFTWHQEAKSLLGIIIRLQK